MLPPDSTYPGNITFSECVGFGAAPAPTGSERAPVAGVTVSGAPSYYLFKKYVDTTAPDTTLENVTGPFPIGIIVTFDFSYNVATP